MPLQVVANRRGCVLNNGGFADCAAGGIDVSLHIARNQAVKALLHNKVYQHYKGYYMSLQTLLSNVGASFEGPWIPFPQLAVSRMGFGTVYVTGNLGTTTVTLQATYEDVAIGAVGTITRIAPLTDYVFTAAGGRNLEINATYIRAVTSGGSGTGIFCVII